MWTGYGDAGLGLPEAAETGERRVIADELDSEENMVIFRRWENKDVTMLGIAGMIGDYELG